jgi:RNA polymerase sigma factor (sigma-70 family)
MNEFTDQDVQKIIEEAHQCQGNVLAEKAPNLVFRVVQVKLRLFKIPFINEDVEDFTQLAFVDFMENCYEKIRKYSPKISSFKNWLALLTRNVVVDELNKRKDVYTPSNYVIRTEEEKADRPIDLEIDKMLDQIQKLDKIKEYMTELTPKQQLALAFTYFDGLSTEHIIRLMKISEKNYFVILKRAREKLKKILKKNETQLFE